MIDYRAGNAQVFDGSFDYDTLASYSSPAQAQPFSFLFECKLTTKITTGLWSDVVGGIGMELYIEGTGKLRFLIANGPGNLYYVNTTQTVTAEQNTIIFTWSGSVAKIYLNGTALTINTISNTLVSYLSGTRTAYLASRPAGIDLMQGKMKLIEAVDRVVTAQEISDATAGGSFRAAGIPYDGGEYLVAINFDKADGQNPTTFAGTPSYTITGFGGTTYATYL